MHAMAHPEISVAPMMAHTDRHCRRLHREFTRAALLYTEMITVPALLRGPRARLLGFDALEHPVAAQLGGADPQEVAAAAELVQAAGYDAVNLNVGCPSGAVQRGRFGAVLMAEPERVAAIARHSAERIRIPFTVKCRIGVDGRDDFRFLERFVATVADAGVDTFIVHARKALLGGLSPRDNRRVPPLRHEQVYRLKARFPDLTIITNGGIASAAEAARHLAHVDGVMIGRAACDNPWLLAELEGRSPTLDAVLGGYLPYIRAELARGTRLRHIARHLAPLFRGRPGARQARRVLLEGARDDAAGVEVIERARRALNPLRRAA